MYGWGTDVYVFLLTCSNGFARQLIFVCHDLQLLRHQDCLIELLGQHPHAEPRGWPYATRHRLAYPNVPSFTHCLQ